jgi:GNAT-family acetyltransferase (TIGR03103 family)
MTGASGAAPKHAFTVEEDAQPYDLDPSSRLVIDEARARGIEVEILAPRAEYYRLQYAGRSVTVRESLSELTSAVALSRCDDKRITSGILRKAGLSVAAQLEAGSTERNRAFLAHYGTIVVKPARGEQGRGVCVGIRSEEALEAAIQHAREVSATVLLEELVEGMDLRLIVINGELVAAAVRVPPAIVGDAQHSVRELIAMKSKQREAETSGESKIPIDVETVRCVFDAGYALDDILPAGKSILVRRAANLHTGGTIHDVTASLHPALVEVGIRAAKALEIPVVGLDLMVPSPDQSRYWIIEANERPGLANHEPQPTAQRFVDFLFPETRPLSTERGLC